MDAGTRLRRAAEAYGELSTSNACPSSDSVFEGSETESEREIIAPYCCGKTE